MNALQLLNSPLPFNFPLFVTSERKNIHVVSTCKCRKELNEFLSDKSGLEHKFHFSESEANKTARKNIKYG